VAVTYNDSGDRKLHLYINGTEVSYVASPAVKGKLLVSSNTLIVGNRLTGDRSFQGNLDELYVYNRALSASEVKTLSH
jgi:arabinan endo-1,5-alpha-L-arabinosidase